MCTKLRFTDAKRHKLKITKFMFWLYSQACHFEIPQVTAVASMLNTVNTCVSSMFPTLFFFAEKKIIRENLLNCIKVISQIYQKIQFVEVMKKSDY